MPLSAPKTEYLALRRFSDELEARYIAPHLGTVALGHPTRSEELDVAAFAVLIHGALENFVEGLSLWILSRIEKNWLRNKVSRSTVSLLLNASSSVDHCPDPRTVFDLIREAINAAKSSYASTVERNNGITVKHLRTLLTPLGIDVPTDPLLIGSLDTLVKMRHMWAHQYRFGAKITKSAADAQKTASDCLKLAEEIYKRASALRL